MKNITQLKCFNEVADVIGKSRATAELWKVVHSGIIINIDNALTSSFNWADSAQGASFWANIRLGRNPYEVENV